MRNLRTHRNGHAVIETAFLAPWLFLLFVGILDFGFFAYAAICTENAARVAALQTSSSLELAQNVTSATALAKNLVVPEMNSLPNAKTLTAANIASSAGAVSDTNPVAVVVQAINGPDGQPASRVSVTYLSIPMIPIPGIMMGRMTLTRSATMRVRAE